MAPNFSNFSPYDIQGNARPSHPRAPSARSSGNPGWLDSQNESSAPRAGQPAPPTLVNPTSYATSENTQYQSVQHPNLGHSPHSGNQPVVYPVSSQRTPMNDGPYPSTNNTFSRQNDPSARGPVAHRGSDPPRMHLDHTAPRRPTISSHSYGESPEMPTMDVSHHPRPGNWTVPPFNQGSASSHQHPSHFPRDMSSMLSEFSISSPTPPSFASAASPYFDKTLVQPRMLTMQMKSDSLEAVDDDSESLNTFNSFTKRSDRSTADNIHDGVPSRSSSSQSSASRSTSESDEISSIPIGRTTGHLSNAASTSSAGGAPRKNKMHQCSVCGKSFPRPSGLETHMNSHTGAKPHRCQLPGCDKAFAVRSNAKRHYKTHGYPPSAAESHESQSTFSVDFNPPHVTYNNEPRGDFPELKWVQPGQTTRTSRDEPDSPSGSDEVDSRPGPSSSRYPQPGPSFRSRSRYDGTHPYHSK